MTKIMISRSKGSLQTEKLDLKFPVSMSALCRQALHQETPPPPNYQKRGRRSHKYHLFVWIFYQHCFQSESRSTIFHNRYNKFGHKFNIPDSPGQRRNSKISHRPTRTISNFPH